MNEANDKRLEASLRVWLSRRHRQKCLSDSDLFDFGFGWKSGQVEQFAIGSCIQVDSFHASSEGM